MLYGLIRSKRTRTGSAVNREIKRCRKERELPVFPRR